MVYLNYWLAITTTAGYFRNTFAVFSSITCTFFIYAICTITFWIITSHM